MSRELEKKLADETPDAMIATTVQGNVVHWNKGAEAMFGYTSSEAEGHSLSELITPTDRLEEDQQYRDEALRAEVATRETVRHRKDGSLLYVDVSTKAIRDAQGRVECILSLKKDVTHLKALRDAKLIEAKFRDLLESTPDAIIIANLTGRIVLANGHAEKLFGYQRKELLGKPVEILLPKKFHGSHVGHRAQYFSQPRTRAMGAGLELYGLHKSGTEFPVEISLSPLETEQGTLVSSAIRDITERKRFEQTLQEKNVELENANLAKNRFLATMSHELRTPLNAIIGFTGTLLMKLPGPLTVDQEKQLRTIQTSGNHLLSLINDLLDLAKIESGKVQLKVEPVACAGVLEEVGTALRPLAEMKELTLKVVLPEDGIAVVADRRALSQILLNLVNNAIKFTEKGMVQLEVREQRSNGKRTTEFWVADTGMGIRQEDQARLFQAFSRIGTENARRTEGTGLGLHLSQRLAELLGGRITLESEYGKGSQFKLILPGAEKDAEACPAKS